MEPDSATGQLRWGTVAVRPRWPRRAELFLGRCKRRRAGPPRRGPSSTRSGRARSDASRVWRAAREGRALSLESPAQVWAAPSPLLSATVAAPRLRLLSAAPPDCCCIPAGRAAPAGRPHRRPSAAAPRARPPRSWQLCAASVQPEGGRARRAGRGSPAGARPRAERAAPPSVWRAATASSSPPLPSPAPQRPPEPLFREEAASGACCFVLQPW